MSRAILASFIGLVLLAPIILGAPLGHPVEQITVSVEALNLLVQNSETAFERRYTTLWRLAPDERPKGARRVTLESRFPSIKYLTYLVSELGYDGSAAFAAMARGHLPYLHAVDRRKARGANPDPVVHPRHPYIPASPGRRTTVGGGLTKEKVSRALAQRAWDDNTREGVFEVVYFRQSAKRVAAERGLKLTTVYQYSSRLRADLCA
jgi:hypothetical protein